MQHKEQDTVVLGGMHFSSLNRALQKRRHRCPLARTDTITKHTAFVPSPVFSWAAFRASIAAYLPACLPVPIGVDLFYVAAVPMT